MSGKENDKSLLGGAIERIRFWLACFTLVVRALRRCFFAVLAVMAINAFFAFVPQGKELLALISEGGPASLSWLAFLALGAGAVAMIAWYSSRVLMQFHDLSDTKIQGDELAQFATDLSCWFPRILGAFCIVPLPFYLADVGVTARVLNSPSLIVTAFSLFAAIDVQRGYVRRPLYRWGVLSCLGLVCLSHDWSTELAFDVAPSWAAYARALFAEGVASTGIQILIALGLFFLLDRICSRLAREGASTGAEPSNEARRTTLLYLLILAIAGILIWTAIFWETRQPNASLSVVLMLFSAVVICSFFVHRRDWFPKAFKSRAVTHEPGKNGSSGEGTERVSIAPLTKAILWSALVFAIVFFALVCWRPIEIGERIGAPALLLFAIALWIVLGAVVLTIVPKAYNFPSLGILVFVVAGCNTLVNPPITITTAPPSATSEKITACVASQRPSLEEAFKIWLTGREQLKDGPIYLVAAAGGGIRAAFLTASYLAAADDVTDGRFGDRIFVISGVSGGSVGAAFYMLTRHAKQLASANGQDVSMGPRQRAVNKALSADFLSPVAATFLFPDLTRIFLIPRWPSKDRGRILEDAWSREADRLAPDVFDSRFLDFVSSTVGASGPCGIWVPHLVLNATRVQSGQRVIASTLKWDAQSAVDLLDSNYETQDISFAGAIHNSARFTYVSPAGAYYGLSENVGGDTGGKSDLKGQLADGGYFDNSALLSVLEILDELRQSNPETAARVHVIVITNDGNESTICPHPMIHPSPRVIDQVQLAAPITTFFATRSARAELSKAQLEHKLRQIDSTDPCKPGPSSARLHEVSLNKEILYQYLVNPGTMEIAAASTSVQRKKQASVWVQQAPLGWTLSASTSDWLSRYALSEARLIAAQPLK